MLQPAEPVEAVERRQRTLPGRRDTLAHRHGPPQHLDEKAGQRQVRPLGIGGRVHQHDPALTAFLGGDERRPVSQPGPGLVGQIEIGLGQNLARHRHVGWDGEPGERALGGKRREPRRFFPGQRAPKRTAAAAQPYRQQMIALLGKARPGKAQQQASGLDPFLDAFLFGWRVRTGIGIDQHRDFPL